MTETQTPNPDCPQCAGTGFIPPFMDPCVCPPVSSFAGGTEVDEAIARIGETSTTITGGTVVWTGTEWAPVKTEALTPAEFAAKYPKPHRSGDADFDELMDEANAWDAARDAADAADDAEAAGLAAAAAVVDEVDAEPWPAGALLIDGVFVDPTTDPDGPLPTPSPAAPSEYPEPDYAAGYGEAGIYSDPSISYGPAKKTGKPMTSAQEALLARLIAERDAAHPVVAHAIGAASGTLQAREASKLIDALMVVPADPAKKPARQNSYDGICRHCGGAVPAMTGVIHKIDGRWQNRPQGRRVPHRRSPGHPRRRAGR